MTQKAMEGCHWAVSILPVREDMWHMVSDLSKDFRQTVRPEIGSTQAQQKGSGLVAPQARGCGFFGVIISQPALLASRLCRRKFPQTSTPAPSECQ